MQPAKLRLCSCCSAPQPGSSPARLPARHSASRAVRQDSGATAAVVRPKHQPATAVGVERGHNTAAVAT